MKTGTWQTCEVATCGLVGRHVGGRASGLVKQLLTVSWQAHVRKLSTPEESSCHLGMEHLGGAGNGEVEACRGGGVVEAEAEAILNNLARIGLLIYSLELEE